jgi:hypothetical protein
MNKNPTEHPDIHLLQAASSYLMTRYSQRKSPDTAQGVVDHLRMLLSRPEIQASDHSMVAYQHLLHEWTTILSAHGQSTTQGRTQAKQWVTFGLARNLIPQQFSLAKGAR